MDQGFGTQLFRTRPSGTVLHVHKPGKQAKSCGWDLAICVGTLFWEGKAGELGTGKYCKLPNTHDKSFAHLPVFAIAQHDLNEARYALQETLSTEFSNPWAIA